MRRLFLADASKSIRPLRQGELDSLCGLYAIINAVRVVLGPRQCVGYAASVSLFKVGLRSLQRSRKLLRGIGVGIDEPTLSTVCTAVIDEANRLLRTDIRLVRPPGGTAASAAAAIKFIKRQLQAGSPVLVGFEGRLDHWTLVTRYSASRLTLFDSSGLHWVPIAAVCLADDGSGKPHPITERGLIAVSMPAVRVLSGSTTSFAGDTQSKRSDVASERTAQTA